MNNKSVDLLSVDTINISAKTHINGFDDFFFIKKSVKSTDTSHQCVIIYMNHETWNLMLQDFIPNNLWIWQNKFFA